MTVWLIIGGLILGLPLLAALIWMWRTRDKAVDARHAAPRSFLAEAPRLTIRRRLVIHWRQHKDRDRNLRLRLMAGEKWRDAWACRYAPPMTKLRPLHPDVRAATWGRPHLFADLTGRDTLDGLVEAMNLFPGPRGPGYQEARGTRAGELTPRWSGWLSGWLRHDLPDLPELSRRGPIRTDVGRTRPALAPERMQPPGEPVVASSGTPTGQQHQSYDLPGPVPSEPYQPRDTDSHHRAGELTPNQRQGLWQRRDVLAPHIAAALANARPDTTVIDHPLTGHAADRYVEQIAGGDVFDGLGDAWFDRFDAISAQAARTLARIGVPA